MSLSVRRFLVGSGLAAATTAALAAAMVPLRGQLGIATAALVLVVPVVIGVTTGGFAAGLFSVGIGFLVYDLLFIPPYGTLSVGASQNWVALGVYVAVMLLVAKVVADLATTRAEARRRAEHIRRLFELSDMLVREQGETELLQRVVTAVREVFAMSSVVLLLPGRDGLIPVATAGPPWSAGELAALVPKAGVTVRAEMAENGVLGVALAATGSPVGLMGMRGPALGDTDRELLRAFANQAAISLERARLREQAIGAELAEETERLQKALFGAVSHDLRTPLATIKVSASTLRRPGVDLSEQDRQELLAGIDFEADRLSRLVTNLLDMTRVQAGALAVTGQPVAVGDLVDEALGPLEQVLAGRSVNVTVPGDLPLVYVDDVLIGQVLVNLVENAARHSPAGTPVTLDATFDATTGKVLMAVADTGPGLPAGGDHVFELFHGEGPRRGTGVGLSIAKAFVEAHGEHIWAETGTSGGARFFFTLSTFSEGHGQA